jgi:transcriptional regulator with XRE-family HTH domain
MKLTTGEKLKDERVKRNLTSKQVCDEIEKKYGYRLAEATYNEMENDKQNKNEEPKNFGYKAFVYLAKYYNVSTDYLLGLTETSSIEPDIQNACKVTGLSEKAIEKIIDNKKICFPYFNPVDEFLQSNDFDLIMVEFLEYVETIISTKEKYKESFDKRSKIFEAIEKNKIDASDMKIMGISLMNQYHNSLNILRAIDNDIKSFLDNFIEGLLKKNKDLIDMRYIDIDGFGVE